MILHPPRLLRQGDNHVEVSLVVVVIIIIIIIISSATIAMVVPTTGNFPYPIVYPLGTLLP